MRKGGRCQKHDCASGKWATYRPEHAKALTKTKKESGPLEVLDRPTSKFDEGRRDALEVLAEEAMRGPNPSRATVDSPAA